MSSLKILSLYSCDELVRSRQSEATVKEIHASQSLIRLLRDSHCVIKSLIY